MVLAFTMWQVEMTPLILSPQTLEVIMVNLGSQLDAIQGHYGDTLWVSL